MMKATQQGVVCAWLAEQQKKADRQAALLQSASDEILKNWQPPAKSSQQANRHLSQIRAILRAPEAAA